MGDRSIGGGRCFVIAEGGVNHNGELSLAHQLIAAAADSGADAIKFQTFDPDQLAADTAPKADYQLSRTNEDESQLDMLRRLVLPADGYPALAEHARRRGIMFLSTAFDTGSADSLHALGMPAFKVPSGEITNLAHLTHVARYGKPVLLSTGMATQDEVRTAVDCLRASGARDLALFHCVTSYPAAPEDCNLRAMETLRKAFEVPVGWSDHTEGIEISLAAVAAGAELLEKHLTLDRSLPGPDHLASIEPEQLAALVRGVRRIEAALGDGVKLPRAAEIPLRNIARRSLHAVRALPRGAVLTSNDIVALRPGTGLPPSALSRVVGRPLLRAITAGQMLSEQDIA